MKRINFNIVALCSVILLPILCANSYAQNIAIVNGKAIPTNKFVQIAKMLPNGSDPEVQKKIKQTLINRELFLQEANKRGIILKPQVQMQIDEAKEQIIFANLMEDYIKQSINPLELKKQYETLIKTENGKEYKARHILVSNLEEARQVLQQLKKGANFTDLAKNKSIDKGSAVNGGDLGWAKPQTFVAEFSKALVGLTKGQTTDSAVQTQFGYHIIKLDDIKDGQPPTFEEVKESLVQVLASNPEWQKQKMHELQNKLIKNAVIK